MESSASLTANTGTDAKRVHRLLESSRVRLLDLTLKNKLLNFTPADPTHNDDSRAHKFLVVEGHLKAAWKRLIFDEKPLRIFQFRPNEIKAAMRQTFLEIGKATSTSEARKPTQKFAELKNELSEGEKAAEDGNVWVQHLGDIPFQKRLARLRDEAKTLEDTTGDSAFFMVFGFLRWQEKQPREGTEPNKFAPLLLAKISLTEDGRGQPGTRKYRLSPPEDEPQHNPSLREKLKQEWDLIIPEFAEDDDVTSYLAKVRRCLPKGGLFEVQETMALGFFNFARYRLWLDLDPQEWKGASPAAHPVVRSLLTVEPLANEKRVIDVTRDDGLAVEIARLQEKDDIPIVMDADSSQYSALLNARKGKSFVVVGPPGSGKSQTITNLISMSIAEGKKVLFVAQKLPALDVVYSRMRRAGLSEFCLQLYSSIRGEGNDRKPISPVELHHQLQRAQQILNTRPRQPSVEPRAQTHAKKLNAYVELIHSNHPLHGESLHLILSNAIKLRDDATNAWGEKWTDALLEIALPEGTAVSFEWTEHRSRFLADIARLRYEAGDFWIGWTPEQLTMLELPRVERALERYFRSVRDISAWCSVVDETVKSYTFSQLHDLHAVSKKLIIPSSFSEAFVRSILGTEDGLKIAHEIEHELARSEDSTIRATRILVVRPDGIRATSVLTLTQLNEVSRYLESSSTFEAASDSTKKLGELLDQTDAMGSLLRAEPTGLSALLGSQTDAANGPQVVVLVRAAQQEAGVFRRAPATLLIALARRLVTSTDLADEALLIADRLDELTSLRGTAALTFSRTLRAEKFVQDDLISAVKGACALGLSAVSAANSEPIEEAIGELAEACSILTNGESELLQCAAGTAGNLRVDTTRQLASCYASLPEGSLLPPSGTDARVVQAWASGIISEKDARAAAFAHEKAAEYSAKLRTHLNDSAPLTKMTGAVLQGATEAAEYLGQCHSDLRTLRDMRSKIDAVERGSVEVMRFVGRFDCSCEAQTFGAVRKAIKVVTELIPVPQFGGMRVDVLSDFDALRKLHSATEQVRRLYGSITPDDIGALRTFAALLQNWLSILKSAQAAAAPGTNGLRQPVTPAEFFTLDAVVEVLRRMPSLPVGCDPSRMCNDQHVTTVRLLSNASKALRSRIEALPAETNYDALTSAKEAKIALQDARELGDSLLRQFSSRWRTAKASIRRFAPKSIKWADALSAFATACEIKKDEEEHLADATAVTILGPYFRGAGTDWKPFLTFVDWATEVRVATNCFDKTDRIISDWLADPRRLSEIAVAADGLRRAQKACGMRVGSRGPDDILDPNLRLDVLIERVSTIVARIESVLSSPFFASATASTHDSGDVELPSVLTNAEVAVTSLHALRESVATVLSESTRFDGTENSWNAVRSAVGWALRAHEVSELRKAFPALITAASKAPMDFDDAGEAAKVTMDQLACLEGHLTHSKLRPSDDLVVSTFSSDVRQKLGLVDTAFGMMKSTASTSMDEVQETAKLIDAYLAENTRAEPIRSAMAPTQPTIASVDVSMRWAVALADHGLPPRVIALLASSPTRSSEINELLRAAAHFVACSDAATDIGCPTAAWVRDATAISDCQQQANALASVLSACRNVAAECAAKPDSTLGEIWLALSATKKSCEVLAMFPKWAELIGCDPSSVESPGNAIRETAFWVESLISDRIPAEVLAWITSYDCDNRIQWWASLVKSAKVWRQLRSAVVQAALPDFDESTPLTVFRSKISSNLAALNASVEHLAGVIKNRDATLASCREAANALSRAADAQERAALLSQRLAGAETLTAANDIAAHRFFATTLKKFPIEVYGWMNAAPFQPSIDHLGRLSGLIDEMESARSSLADTMREFGKYADDGPSGLLSECWTVDATNKVIERSIAEASRLAPWAALHREKRRASKLGLDRLTTEILKTRATSEQAIVAFSAAVAWQKALVVWRENPNLERFRSFRHEELRADFKKEDLEAIRGTNKKRVIASLREQRSSKGDFFGVDDTASRLLTHEAGKRRKLVPIRKLVQMAGPTIQDTCPCWIATPRAVAQFIAPGSVDFDVVIMDEASQLTPEDSWGAIARGKQLIVVGDPKQMPPTDFFENASRDDDEADQEETEGSQDPASLLLRGDQQESILIAAEACLSQVWLNWHYRSLHHELIAPANALSYGKRLILFPSCHVKHAHLGVSHKYQPNGTATKKSVVNVAEAEALIDRLTELAAEFAQPKHKRVREQHKAPGTVGIVAMNIHQQEVIKELIEKRRSADPAFHHHFSLLEADPIEPIFVRNLENIQGDERDIILISTTYGPETAGGTPTQHFGPLNRDGGERRLNVLITRSKWRMEVFTSLKASQLVSQKTGVQHLRAFLEFCENGGRMTEAGVSTGRTYDSPFEAHVHALLAAKGYIVEPQIGVAGYYVDLAVKDPIFPDRFVLGIECDGASYHSGRAARDRDRLREQVLEDRGWDLHRIWSTEWFYNNAAARRSLIEAIERKLTK